MAKRLTQLPSTGTVDDSDIVIVVDGAVTKQTTVGAMRPTATTSTAGMVELATDAEAIAGTDTGRGVTPAGLKANLDLGLPEVNAMRPPYSAAGDGVTDDTAALQAWLDHIVANHLTGRLPVGRYRLTGSLTVTESPSYGWSILGSAAVGTDGSVLLMDANNVPILSIGDGTSFHHTVTIKGVRFEYVNAQSSSNTSANCIHLNCGQSQGMFASRFEDLAFANGYYAFNSPSGGWWATNFDGVSMSTMSGGAMNWTGVTGGMPNNRYGRWSINVDGMAGPVFNDWKGYNQTIGALEFLAANQTQQLIETASGFEADIGSLKLELANYTSAVNIFSFQANHRIRIGTVSVGGSTAVFTPASGIVTLINLGVGGITEYSYCDVGAVACRASSLTGNVVVFGGGNNLGRIRCGSAHLANGWTLQSTGSTTTGNFLKVDNWANGALSDGKGDADYTVTLGDPNIVHFSTAFTAQRTITLPAQTGNDLHNGLFYDLIFDGAVNGANTALIKQGSTTIRTQTVDRVRLRYVWRRSTWVLVDVVNIGAPQTGYTTFANLTTDRTCDANTVVIAELADIVGTLIEDLKVKGIISA
jgi:hypothetical protein